MKRKIVISLAIILFCLGFVSYQNYTSKRNITFYKGLPVNYTHATFAYDTSTLPKAIGSSDYAFLCKVNKIIRTEYKNPVEVEVDTENTKIVYDPYTVYSITVVKNIKGNLQTDSEIELLQYGGINYDKKSYTFLEGSEYLSEGEYYVLMPDAMSEKGEIEVADKNKIFPIGNDIDLEKTKSGENILSKFSQALKNQEIPLTAEGKKIKNNYASKYDIKYVNESK